MLIVVKQIAEILIIVMMFLLLLFSIVYIIYACKNSIATDRMFAEALEQLKRESDVRYAMAMNEAEQNAQEQNAQEQEGSTNDTE